MKIIGIGVDYSNICKNYNTAYLDRDNTDPATKNCMKAVVSWMEQFLLDITKEFSLNIFKLSSDVSQDTKEIASNRFLFYSLEKAITIQSFVIAKDSKGYSNLLEWSLEDDNSLVIQNDEEGEGFYLYCDNNSSIHQWLIKRLEDFTLDEVPFNTKY